MIFFSKNPNLKKKFLFFFIFFGGGGGGGGRGGRGGYRVSEFFLQSIQI